MRIKKSASMFNVFLHLFAPKLYLPIVSQGHKDKIYNTFKHLISEECNNEEENKDYKNNEALYKIKEKLKKELKPSKDDFNFYEDDIYGIWAGGFEFDSKNLIIHGAPGTGKTYMTLKTIKSIKNKAKIIGGDAVEYKVVQFHPSYGYEDFIEGIKPTGIENGIMKFELKNGAFKQKCIDAFKELEEAEKYKRKPKIFYFVADEINRAELSRVFGELLLCIEDDKRLRFENNELKGTLLKTPNSALWDNKIHAVCEVDGEGYFGVPENIYFIGTMNDIDKSVDSFDMALRRRFVWKRYGCDYDVIIDKYSNLNLDDVERYIEICKNLNKYITKDLGLGEDFELGHSYFMKLKKLTQKELERVWSEHIEPLLIEYLRSIYAKSEITIKINDAKKIFSLK